MAPFSIVLPRIPDDDEYDFRDSSQIVQKVLAVHDRDHTSLYELLFEDEHTETKSLEELKSHLGGIQAVERFHNDSHHGDSDGFESNVVRDDSAEESDVQLVQTSSDSSEELEDPSDENPPRRRSNRKSANSTIASRWNRPTRRSSRRTSKTEVFNFGSSDDDDDDDESDDDSEVIQSRRRGLKRKRVIPSRLGHDSGSSSMRQKRIKTTASRHSQRATRAQKSMAEVGEGEIYRSDSDVPRKIVPKFSSAKEIFQDLAQYHPFSIRHCRSCETCGGAGGGAHGPLVFCQGCSLAYHRTCIGHRGSRDHLVTKINEDDYVLQCRRCIGLQRKKESTAPDQGMCQVCREIGPACVPFKERKTPVQEQKERDDNHGVDPVVRVNRALINNASNVFFRCTSC